jgi:hypothetical protein
VTAEMSKFCERVERTGRCGKPAEVVVTVPVTPVALVRYNAKQRRKQT